MVGVERYIFFWRRHICGNAEARRIGGRGGLGEGVLGESGEGDAAEGVSGDVDFEGGFGPAEDFSEEVSEGDADEGGGLGLGEALAEVFQADAGVDEDGDGVEFEECEGDGEEVDAGAEEEGGAGAGGDALGGEAGGVVFGEGVELVEGGVGVVEFARTVAAGGGEEGVGGGQLLRHEREVGGDVLVGRHRRILTTKARRHEEVKRGRTRDQLE